MDERAFSSIDFVGQCLLDPEKASAFQKAIQSAMKPEYTALDVGTGSGILALFSAAAGAKKVFALEFDPFVAKIAKQNFKNNGFEEKMILLNGDARSFVFEKGPSFDLVTMEMLSSGMVDEMQVQAINNLHEQGVVSAETIFIPSRQDTYVTLAEVDYKLFGFNMPMILHAWKVFRNIKVADRTEKVLLNSVDFSKKTPEAFEALVRFTITEGGRVNTLWLSSQAFLNDTDFLEDTISLNPPVAIPLPEMSAAAGDEVAVRVQYKFGYGYQNFSATVE